MTAGVSLPDAPSAVAGRAIFSANGTVFTVADLVRRASAGGREAHSGTGNPAQVEESFRRARGLLRGEQLQAWLADWHVGAGDFVSWTRDVASGGSTASGWCTVLCSGELDAITATMVSAAAAACELGSGPTDAATFVPEAWTERLVALGTTPEALAAAIEDHRLEWTSLHTISVTTPSRGIAEELRHQVRSDGADLAAAASSANCPVHEDTDLLSSITPADVQAALAGAQAGELVGPVRTGDHWILIEVVARAGPDLSDPGSRARAEAAVRAELIARAVARHVVA